MTRSSIQVVTALAAVAMTTSLVSGSQAAGTDTGSRSSTAEHEPRITAPQNPGTAVLEMPRGSIDEALTQLPGLTRAILAKSKVPGLAVAVVHDRKTVFARGYGVKEMGKPGRVDPQTVFQLASLSKPISATVVAGQVSKSLVGWDTPVSSELPDFALADPWVSAHATVGDFFSHRTGLPHAAGDLLEDIGYDRGYILDHLRYEPLTAFRSTYAYANFGLTAGAEAVARAAGTDWATLSEKALYEPMGMTATSSRYEDFLARTDRAALHAKVGDRFEPLYQRNADAQAPAGGVSSNVVDLSKWMSMVLDQGEVNGVPLIEADALLPAISAEMITAPSSDVTARPGMYGYGFNVGVQPSGRVTMSHSGAFADGAGTTVTMIPSADIGIVVLTNGAPVGAAESLAAEFLDVVQFGHVTRDWWKTFQPALAPITAPVGDLVDVEAPVAPAPAHEAQAYTGTFHNQYYGDAAVTAHDGRLSMAVGPRGTYTFALDHWDGDTFSFVPTGENAPAGSLSSAKFTITEGEASAVTLNFFNASGLGTWTR